MDDLVSELAPNNSEAQGIYAESPTREERAEDEEEQVAIASALPIMEELIEWFDEQAAGADSVIQARNTLKTFDELKSLETALIVHEIVARLLQAKRDELSARFDNYRHNQNNTNDMA